MSISLEHTIADFLKTAEENGQFRALRTVTGVENAHVIMNGKSYINFSSNNYMGLSQHPLLIERSKKWLEKWGAGSSASRLVVGNLDLHEQIEQRLLEEKGGEACLIFNSGFQANAAILSSLFDQRALGCDIKVYCDRLNHASMHYGIHTSGIRQSRYHHNDLDHLESLLIRDQETTSLKFIVTESVFSMDGDISDIDRLITLSKKYDAHLYIDEAHATGVLGNKGFGLTAQKDVTFKMGTFSKGLGGFGAYLICPKYIKDYLINHCKGFIYSTSLPPSVLGAIDAAIELVPYLDDDRKRLRLYSDQVRQCFKSNGHQIGESQTQIVPLILGDEKETLEFSKKLDDAGILAIAIRPPTVPKGTSRIRFALNAHHSQRDIDYLCETVCKLS